jgi:heparosan-N-sulfate-glucuronate 5-epimerase
MTPEQLETDVTLSLKHRQRVIGDPNLLSTARSFRPEVGPDIGDGELRGYYIDFRFKLEDPVFPPDWLAPPEQQLHVATAQWALGSYERYLAGEGDRWLAGAVEAGDYLIEHQEKEGPMRGGWIHRMRMPHTYVLRPPWLSAMAQGEGASLMSRLHKATGDQRYADAAVEALRALAIRTEDGGVVAELDDGPFYEEYPTDPPSFVLNGGLFALWGFHDAAIGLGAATAARAFDEGVDALAASIHRWDTGYWSLYDLFPHPVANVASAAYHLLHTTQLKAMQVIAPRSQFAAAIERFERYSSSRAKRSRAFAHKVQFRLLVPRNALLSGRLPWSSRGTDTSGVAEGQ